MAARLAAAERLDFAGALQSAEDRKVVHLIAPMPVGGAESVVRALALGTLHSGRGVDVVAILDDARAHPFVARVRKDGVAVTTVHCGRRRYLAESRRVAGILRQTRAAVLHTHTPHADFVGYLAARSCGIPVVATVHGFTGTGWKNRAYIWLDMRLIRRFDAVICVSTNVRDRVIHEGCDPRRVHVVPNGYAPQPSVPRDRARARLGLENGGPVVGWVGRMTPEKGADLFVESLVRVRAPGVTAVLVGAGPERERVADQAAAHGPAFQAIRFAGEIDDAASLLTAFDVLAVSSRTEGTPMVVLEAMATGVPVVAFAVGGIPSVLDSRCAWVVPPGDTTAFAAALEQALTNPAEAARRATAAKARLQDGHDLDRWVGQVDGVYDAVVRSLG